MLGREEINSVTRRRWRSHLITQRGVIENEPAILPITIEVSEVNALYRSVHLTKEPLGQTVPLNLYGADLGMDRICSRSGESCARYEVSVSPGGKCNASVWVQHRRLSVVPEGTYQISGIPATRES